MHLYESRKLKQTRNANKPNEMIDIFMSSVEAEFV